MITPRTPIITLTAAGVMLAALLAGCPKSNDAAKPEKSSVQNGASNNADAGTVRKQDNKGAVDDPNPPWAEAAFDDGAGNHFVATNLVRPLHDVQPISVQTLTNNNFEIVEVEVPGPRRIDHDADIIYDPAAHHTYFILPLDAANNRIPAPGGLAFASRYFHFPGSPLFFETSRWMNGGATATIILITMQSN